MIDIEKLIYSDPRLKDLSTKEMEKYDKFVRHSIEQLITDKSISETEIILFIKAAIETFFIVIEDIRREKSKK